MVTLFLYLFKVREDKYMPLISLFQGKIIRIIISYTM